MKILVTGASGLIGTALATRFAGGPHTLFKLTRRPAVVSSEKRWDPLAGALDPSALEGVDAVIHLAGEGVGARWTAARRRRILESRSRGTGLIAESIARASPRPRTLISASAVGYYGDRGDEILTEESALGLGFLPRVALAWEEATAPAERVGVRVVRLRIGIVLSPHGGALARMVPIFRLGLGGPLGHGRQWMSWIAMEDLVAAIEHVLDREDLSGPVNLVAPGAVSSAQFARALGKALSRPALLPAPAFALRLIFGEMADGALLASQRVRPARLEASGFRFRFPALEGALQHCFTRPSHGHPGRGP